MRRAFLLFAVVVGICPAAAAELAVGAATAEYQHLLLQRYATTSIPIPPEGITWTRDTATLTLTRGEVWLMEPSSNGVVTGFVFKGEARFRMTIPDPVERRQLRHFAQRDIQEIDTRVTQVVGRFSDATGAKLFPAATAAAYAPNGTAADRRDVWFADYRTDIDARIVAAMVNPGAMQITLGLDTKDFGWLTYDYDSSRREEIQLTAQRYTHPEVWVSIDRADQRTPEGRPGSVPAPSPRMSHLNAAADLRSRRFFDGKVGMTMQDLVNAKFIVGETLTGAAPETRALQLSLNPAAQELVVRDATGKTLEVIRDHIGKRSAQIDNRYWNDEVVVLLAEPLRMGEEQQLSFTYELELANYAPGGGWYPGVPDDWDQLYTARLELTTDKRHEVRAMGRRESEREIEGGRTSVWIVDKPVRMVTFSTTDHATESEVKVAGIPRVVTFGTDRGAFSNASMMHNVAADVANSMQFYQALLDDPIGGDTFYATSIVGGHGQAFEGFLHLSEATFKSESRGASELFRSHEVAHEWWGHKVGWDSYRDQWLSESFAEYSALLFVQSQVQGGDKLVDEILDAYTGVAFGDLRGGFSKFARPWLLEHDMSKRERIGPLALGWRAATADMPAGYLIQAYYRGPLVLHMIRQTLRFRTGNDELFVKVLRDFLRSRAGKSASTDDFRRILEKDAPAPWQAFFDSWINGVDLPAYSYGYRVDGDTLTVTLKRKEVPDTFFALVPMRIDYEDGSTGYIVVPNGKPDQTVTLRVKKPLRNIVVGPDHSLLAAVRKE